MKIGIIGYGNLGRSLMDGIIKAAISSGDDIAVCDSAQGARDSAEKTYGVSVSPDVNFVIARSDVIFLTVKSYVFEELSKEIDRSLLHGKTIVSFMAGVPIEQIENLIGHVELVRGMPSLAISVCDGVIGYTKAPEHVAAIFHKLGYAFEVAPLDIEKVMAYSSCGLGFAAYLLDAYVAAGKQLGFSEEDCIRITGQTFQNAIDRGSYGDTVRAVATKGGATEQGVLHMEASNVRQAISDAVTKAYDKMK